MEARPTLGDWLSNESEHTSPITDIAKAQSLYDQALGAINAHKFAEAIELLDRAISLHPTYPEAYYKRGNALKNLGHLHEAIASYDQAITREPHFAYAYCNRGVTQQALGMNADALASYDLAILHDPSDAMSHYNRGLVLQEYSRWDEVIASYNRAIEIDPVFADAQYNRSLALLYCGNLEEGWRSYEWRWKNADRLGMGEVRGFSQEIWLGDRPLRGKRLLLHSEGGLGDTLQFSRYAVLAAERGARVYLELQPALHAMLSKLDGVAVVVDKGEALPPFDYHCPLMSLPLAFKTTLISIPPPAKPLQVDEARSARWESLRAERGTPRIGLVWSGNANNANDQRRSVRLSAWAGRLPTGYRYFRLQKDVREEDKDALIASGISSVDDDVQNFLNIGALCQCMDLVISVDTSIAHLSATLGCPTWVMLPLIADWRWLRGRNDSPWYPTIRLFRQEYSGHWGGVFEQVAAALRNEFPVK